jgi:hypothetical protein
LKIISVEENVVHYELYNIEEDRLENVRIPRNTFTNWITNGRWPRVDKMVNESEDFDWIEELPNYTKVPIWDGRDRGTPNMGTQGTVYLYNDKEFKVGGIHYKYRTRRHDGTMMSNDGEVSFYDASITNKQIDDLNTYGAHEVGDPFEGTERLEMSRREYNDNARSGRLLIKSKDINESDEFGWMKEVPSNVYDAVNPGDHIVVTNVTEYLIDTIDYCGEEEHYISKDMGYRVDDIQDMKRYDIDCGLTADYYEWGKDGRQMMRSLKLVDDENGVVFWVTRDMVTIDWA